MQYINVFRNENRSIIEICEYNRSLVQIRFSKSEPTFIVYDDKNAIWQQKWSRIEDNNARVLTALVYFLFWLK